MDVHKPKPWHGWRELAKEVGTIVIGVLIALGAEQTVEALHWRHKLAIGESAVRLELHDDDGPQAYARTLIAGCLDARLDALTAALAADQPRQVIAPLTNAYQPPFRTWDGDAWRAMETSDSLTRLGAREVIRWASPYQVLPALAQNNDREFQDMVALRALDPKPGPLSPLERDRLILTIQRLRAENKGMLIASQVLLIAMQQAGVTLTPADRRRVTAELRPAWGPCLAEAAARVPRLNSQAAPTK